MTQQDNMPKRTRLKQKISAVMADAWEAMRHDEEELRARDRSVLRARAHAIGVVASYGYQGFVAPVIGIWAWQKGYADPNAVIGAVQSGALLAATVAPQFVLVGYNAVGAANRYRETGKTIRQRFPKSVQVMHAIWAHESPQAHGRSVVSYGIQGSVYDHAFGSETPPSEHELRQKTERSMALGTLTSLILGACVGALGKSAQAVADHLPWAAADTFNTLVDEQVIAHPERLGMGVMALTVLSAAGKIRQVFTEPQQ